MVIAHSLCNPILAEHCPSVAQICNIDNCLSVFLSHNGDTGSASSIIGIDESKFVINSKEHLFNGVAQITSCFSNLFPQLIANTLCAMIGYLTPTMSIENCEDATVRVISYPILSIIG